MSHKHRSRPIGMSAVTPIRPVVVSERPRVPYWLKTLAEALVCLVVVFGAYALTTDIADRRVVTAYADGMTFGQQLACRP